MSNISVLGSINMDFILNVDEFPEPGETVKAVDFSRLPGGKGANQAVAASRVGGEVSMFGLLGRDNFGDKLRSSLEKSGVDTSGVESRNWTSGMAVVSVNSEAENEIVVVPGANNLIDEDYVMGIVDNVSKTDVLLLQLEIPLKSISLLLNSLPKDGPKVILDPAPAVSMENLPLNKVDFLTPNLSELNTLAKSSNSVGIEGLLESVKGALIIKRGKEGAEYTGLDDRFSVPTFEVDSVDSTGAGDAFNGAFAVGVSKGWNLKETIKFANAAGSCATIQAGAQPSLPYLEEVRNLMEPNQ